MTRIPVSRALISVSDKTGLTEFARALVDGGVEIVSSGGTSAHLQDAGIPVRRVVDVTGASEMLGGRVKTLHPNIHGAILADLGRPDHRRDLADIGLDPFQLVVVNLYPFEAVVARGVDYATAIENIDIGGPTLIRAAAKNHAWVAVVVSPNQYSEVLSALAEGGTTADIRESLSREAFFRTAKYDAAIVNWLERDGGGRLVLPLTKQSSLRYGENPQQSAALYATDETDGWWSHAEVVQGKEMSFNNYADADAAWSLVSDLPPGSVAVLKHMNACGAASGASMVEAFSKAWECDPVSAFGGVVALNGVLDGETAAAIANYFVEVVIAPAVTADAREILSTRSSLRVLVAPPFSDSDLDVRTIDDGFLIQRRDEKPSNAASWEAQTRQATEAELRDLEIAWIVCAHTKSNAIVIVKDGAAIGVGAGDQSRVGAVERALVRAGERSKGAVCASDAFFPFRDGPDALAAAGITAIVEPGGSMRDKEVVESANEHEVALMFTGQRHFRH
ncbi:MAG: bifunctional phosphoribosylaminoimidazolecarboxamide formyltransferase/IMP cyclohydrolase [Actinomycetota bacterium]|nr:bifunctional phosphoribosylaminoimidazolecarboxamide formyltransferase/IMP cyclohydrolase [Actinomycetota bacterium]